MFYSYVLYTIIQESKKEWNDEMGTLENDGINPPLKKVESVLIRVVRKTLQVSWVSVPHHCQFSNIKSVEEQDGQNGRTS